MLPQKILQHLALRILEEWSADDAASKLHNAVSRLSLAMQICNLQTTSRLFDKASSRGFKLAVSRLHEDLLSQVRTLKSALNEIPTSFENAASVAPSISLLISELRQLNEEFDDFSIEWDDKAIIVTTKPVVLTGVSLGPFEIRLCWERLKFSFRRELLRYRGNRSTLGRDQ